MDKAHNYKPFANRLLASERLLHDSLSNYSIVPAAQWIIHWYEQISSTMDAARAVIEQEDLSAHTPALVLASFQTKGRGRQGRVWESASGSLLGTYIFGSTKPLSAMAGYSLAVGCMIQDTLKQLIPQSRIGLKWPNDILAVDGRKLAGVLIELVSKGEMNYVLTGIGLNLFGKAKSFENSVSLVELCGEKLTPLDVAAKLSPMLYAGWLEFLQLGFKGFKERWLASAMQLGHKLKVDVGNEVIEGVFTGVSETGSMLLKTQNGVREVVSGHLL